MRLAAVLLNWLHQLMLAVWLGGIVTLALSAPALFHQAKAQGDTNWNMPLYRFAGMAVTTIFQRFTTLCVVAGLLLLISGVAYGILAGLCRRRLMVRTVLEGLAYALVLWLAFGLFPEMLQARDAGDMSRFDAMHHTSSHLFSAQLLLLVTVSALTSWMHLDLNPHGASADAAPRTAPGLEGAAAR